MSAPTISKRFYQEVEASTNSHDTCGEPDSGDEAEIPSKFLSFSHSVHISLIVLGEADPRNLVELGPLPRGENMAWPSLNILGYFAFNFGDAHRLGSVFWFHSLERETKRGEILEE